MNLHKVISTYYGEEREAKVFMSPDSSYKYSVSCHDKKTTENFQLGFSSLQQAENYAEDWVLVA